MTTINEPVEDAAETVAVHTTFRRYPAGAAVVSRPGLWERLEASARVTVVSAPAGSGKTVLLRSWIGQAGLARRVAWVPVGRDERDPQRLWLSVLDALRQTVSGSALVRALTAAPDMDGWAIVERLLKDLAPLDDRLWLVVDDVHELGPGGCCRAVGRVHPLGKTSKRSSSTPATAAATRSSGSDSGAGRALRPCRTATSRLPAARSPASRLSAGRKRSSTGELSADRRAMMA